MLSFSQLAVPYNCTRSVSRQIEWASLSPWLCAALTDQWASQLIPSLCFCRVVECLLPMATPVACFPLCQIKALIRLGTVCRSRAVQSDQSHCPKNRQASSTAVSLPVRLNGKNIGWINKSNNQWDSWEQRESSREEQPKGATGSGSGSGKASGWRVIKDDKMITCKHKLNKSCISPALQVNICRCWQCLRQALSCNGPTSQAHIQLCV